MRKLLLMIVALPFLALGADVPPAATTAKATDSDKLKIREAQLARVQIGSQMANLESQWKELALSFQKAQAGEASAIAEVGKKLGCDINPETIECKPKAAAKK